MKEPHGLARDYGKRPDGLTLIPWQSGCSATWDVTIIDTLAASYVHQSATPTAGAAEIAATRKLIKYSALSQSYHFFPVAIETLGPHSASSLDFITDVGKRIAQRTLDSRETIFLFQRISIAIQRFNAVCLAKTFAIP